MRVVDLHGLLAEEALIVITNNLFDYKTGKVDQIMFITGKGTGILKTTLENYLHSNNIRYSIFNDDGAYLINRFNEPYSTYDYDSYEDDEEFSMSPLDVDNLFNNFKNEDEE